MSKGEVRPLSTPGGDLSGYASIVYVDDQDAGLAAGIADVGAAADSLDTRLTNFESEMAQELSGKANASHTHDAAAIASGTIADARLSSNVARRDQANTFSGNVTCPAGDGGLRAGGIAVGHTLPIEAAIAGGQISNWSSGVQKQAIVATQGLNLASDTGIRWSSTTSSQGTVDAALVRGSTGTVDVLSNNGFRSRNLANTADAPIIGGNATFSGTVAMSTLSHGAGNLDVQNSLSRTIRFQNGNITPLSSGNSNLGGSSQRWGWIYATNIEASGGIAFGPRTKSALLAASAIETAGCWRITDSTPAQRLAYPDGTSWRYLSDDTVVT